MAYVSKEWKDIDAEYPNRYTATKSDLTTEVLTMTNNFGTITEPGDVFDAATMNNLESRINAGFTSIPKAVYIGTCDTAAGTAAKAVTVSSDQNFVLEKGTTINVKFANTNTATNVTISVNNGTAYPIWYKSGVQTSATSGITGSANQNIFYVFDGTYWVWQGMGAYMSYSAMTQAEAEAGTSTGTRVVSPAVLKSGIIAHAIPQVDGNERVVGKLGNDTLYEKVFTFAYSDMQGGSQDASRINGVFVLDSNVNYKTIMIESGQIINSSPNNTFNVWSMPLPIASTSGTYARIQIQKSYAEPAAYDGIPFIYFDTTYNASQIFNNSSNFSFVFTIRYTKNS